MKDLEFMVVRKFFAENYTIGDFFISGKKLCNTIEDKNRDLNHDGDLNDKNEGKVFGETCIPFGRYEIELLISPKFKRLLPRLKNVKHFEGILIHAGNTAKDTHGCILPGENTQKGKVLNSGYYENIIVGHCKEAIKNKVKIFITIK